MTEAFLDYTYYTILSACSLVALYRFKSVNKATRFLCLYILYGLLSEILSYHSSITFGNNYLVYNLYDYLTLILLSIFFYLSISSRKSRMVILSVFVALILLLMLNLIYFPSFNAIHQHNIEFIYSFSIIILSLYSIYRMVLKDKNATIYNNPLFWTAMVFVFYKFINIWGKAAVYYPFQTGLERDKDYFHFILLGNNIILYAVLGIVLWLYPKMKENGR